MLVGITAGVDLGVREATQATSVVQTEAGDESEVIFATVSDESLGDELRVTVLATGFGAAGPRSRTRSSPQPTDADVPAFLRRETGPWVGPFQPAETSATPEPALDVWVDPGRATAADIADVYGALSDLHRALGGIGIVLREGAGGEVVELAPEEA